MNEMLRKRMSATQQASEQQTGDKAYEQIFQMPVPQTETQFRDVPICKLHPFYTADIGFHPYPRAKLEAFAEELKENGLYERILVRPIAGTDEFEILAGHNRTEAAKLAGWTDIPATVMNVNDQRAISIAIATNLLRRQDLTIIERGKAYKALLDARNRHGFRTDLTSGESRQKYSARGIVAEFFGVTEYEIRKAVKLAQLILPLAEIVENEPKKLNLACADLIADYDTATQTAFVEMCQIEGYALNKQTGFYPDFEAIEKAGLDGVKMMLVNYPNMPTGQTPTMELFQKIVDFGARHNILIVHDNPYSFILNDNPMSILAVPGSKDICIEMNSLSKSHNMSGWRIGMLASNPQFIEWILKVKSNIDSGMFRPLQMAATKALSCGQEWYDQLNEVYRNRRDIAEKIMKALGCSYDPSQAGLFVWGKIPDSATDAESLADEILYNAHVFITPGFIFGSRGNRYIRISLCAPEKKMQEALHRIEKNQIK